MTNPDNIWPFKEAQQLVKRSSGKFGNKVIFETGFGPSGLPHIGTFAEVARTTWVRNSFKFLTNCPTELIAFSDDMDGLRKVPPNMPKQNMLTEHLGKPLCKIPDPFDEHESYSGYMNSKLQEFLDKYGFDYRFQSSYDAYTQGDFDEGLAIILERVEEINAIILPTLSECKRADWSPFIPVCEKCGRVYSTRVLGYHPQDNTINYICNRQEGFVQSCGHKGTISIFGGMTKVGWKVDWALRWYTYDVDYEMYGADLIESARLSDKILRLMGKQPPNHFFYELFLDEDARKISKSVGKGISIDSWIRNAPLESLLYFIFQNPRRAKRLFWGIVPKLVDEYLGELKGYLSLPSEKKENSAVWHIFNGGVNVPSFYSSVNYSLINNLVSGLGIDDVELIFEYLARYDPGIKKSRAITNDLVKKSINYYQEFVLPGKKYRNPTPNELQMLRELRNRLDSYEGDNEKEIQALPFDVARLYDVPPSELFKSFYEVILGQEQGPRFGTFTLLLGKDRVLALLDTVL
ncbi:MAG: lysine--tRNA ligase [Anaerolineaceae bacterium]|nr:lysine--tRNA ligase [Anaerolineaceae bacterium]